MDIFKSKKFQAALGGIILVVLNTYAPALAGLPIEEIVKIVIAYLLAQGVADFQKEKAKVENGS